VWLTRASSHALRLLIEDVSMVFARLPMAPTLPLKKVARHT
jgi:hypothetical protein